MSSTDRAVVVDDLRKSFGSVVALRGISFEVGRGEVLGLLGPNGAGKTTTVDILSTLATPDSGTAVVAGHNVRTDPAGVRRSIMLTGQQVALDDMLTGRANLVMFGRLQGLKKAEARSRAAELLERFDLADAADRSVKHYSGGMRRRIDIACGLVVRPEVVFLDEPTTGLDPRSRLAAVMFFFSTGFVPLDQFPKWLQPFVEHQPCSFVVEAMRGLSMGGPVLKPVLRTLLWFAGIAAIIAVPLAVGYRRASRRD